MTEEKAGEVVSIPVYPELTEEEQNFVIETIKKTV